MHLSTYFLLLSLLWIAMSWLTNKNFAFFYEKTFRSMQEKRKRITMKEKKGGTWFVQRCPWRQAGGFITITSAAQPKAILLPLFQLSSCHLQNIMHFGFFYANFSRGGRAIFFSSTISTQASNRKPFMAQTLGCPKPCQVKQWLIALSEWHLSPSIKH